MDKNTIWGFVIIGALLFGFAWFNKPSQEELQRQQAVSDSIAAVKEVEAYKAEQLAKSQLVEQKETVSDSVASAQLVDMYGAFAPSVNGDSAKYVIENNKVKLVIDSKGGQISSVELKEYKASNGSPLVLFDAEKDSTSLSFSLVTANNRLLNTKDLYFEGVDVAPVSVVAADKKSFVFRLKTTEGAYLDYVYSLGADDYMVDFSVKAHSLEKVLTYGVNSLEMQWNSKIKQQEKSKKFENRYAALNYKYLSDDLDNLSEAKDDDESITTKLKWVAFKDQFFSTVLIADDAFSGAKLISKMGAEDSEYLKKYSADMSVAFDPTGQDETGFRFYFGPNKFSLLKSYDKDAEGDDVLMLQRLVRLGWGIFGWINRFVVIPIFDWLSSFIGSYGIIILILTIIIKIVLFPMTYKSYVSMAKMRVLKPQIDEINAKHSKDKMQAQQATMALYKKVGVNPLGGCLPMLLQMPILFAMFSFFPASIELRQQSFLWATDLSSYDSVISWSANIPFISQYFGNHLSLFCLLMTITNLVYTHLNMQNQMEGSQQIPGMKYMMYAMPVIFLFMFNDYASGLSYYYFIATLITIVQTVIIRKTVDEEKLLQKLHEKAKNPKKQKKSGFMQKMEEMQRRQLEMQKQQGKRK